MLRTNITKRKMTRKHKDGSIHVYDRWVLSYRDPRTKKRIQKFFTLQKEALSEQRDILLAYEDGTLFHTKRTVPTVLQAFDYWMDNRRGEIKDQTHKGYEYFRSIICGPLLIGNKEQRFAYAHTGKVPHGCKLKSQLGDYLVDQLQTADIRQWERSIADDVGDYTARKARQHLQTMFALVAEDYGIRPPLMPTRLGRGKRREKKKILAEDQIAHLYSLMRGNEKHGIYVMWPFFMGTRPSEQLALHWEDINFDRGIVQIHRMQERTGVICNITKTEAGMREVPIPSVLREWLLEWREQCPRRGGKLQLVFPSQGAKGPWPARKIGGGILLYSNFRLRVWKAAFDRVAEEGIPYITPHAARHSYISALQAKGIEVGLVAKLAGHASPAVTLNIYTHSVRTGEDAVEVLSDAYSIKPAIGANHEVATLSY